MNVLHLDEVDSTNAYIMREAPGLEAPVMVTAYRQTAGQGQRGNSWESAPGENLTFSILYRPQSFAPAAQFSISEAVALAVRDFLALHGVEAEVKWPNDIYVGDRKICGILIRHSVTESEISHTVIGVGINVNQTEFLSDAPNPVSMRQLTEDSYDLPALYAEVGACIERRLENISDESYREQLHDEFLWHLWRGDGQLHPFIDAVSGERFEAAIADVGRQGMLELRLPDGSHRTYAFKEVAFLMNN